MDTFVRVLFGSGRPEQHAKRVNDELNAKYRDFEKRLKRCQDLRDQKMKSLKILARQNISLPTEELHRLPSLLVITSSIEHLNAHEKLIVSSLQKIDGMRTSINTALTTQEVLKIIQSGSHILKDLPLSKVDEILGTSEVHMERHAAEAMPESEPSETQRELIDAVIIDQILQKAPAMPVLFPETRQQKVAAET